jgi:hypothetical protein
MSASYDGRDVLPWMQPEGAGDTLPVGTRLCTFTDYHRAPEGTVIRLGRKGGTGYMYTKRGGSFWPDDGGPGLTPYGLENRPSYVTGVEL